MAFIYKIINNINGKFYIGKTNFTLEKRFKQHISDSKRDRCKDRPLYRAMNKYGVNNFNIELLEETENPIEREIYWIEYYNTYKHGYNATKGGDGKPCVDEEYILNLLHIHNFDHMLVSKVSGHDRITVINIAKKHGIHTKQIRRGEDRNTILTKTQVIQIKILYTPKCFGKRRIAKVLNLDESVIAAVGDVISGKTWKHIEMEIICN